MIHRPIKNITRLAVISAFIAPLFVGSSSVSAQDKPVLAVAVGARAGLPKLKDDVRNVLIPALKAGASVVKFQKVVRAAKAASVKLKAAKNDELQLVAEACGASHILYVNGDFSEGTGELKLLMLAVADEAPILNKIIPIERRRLKADAIAAIVEAVEGALAPPAVEEGAGEEVAEAEDTTTGEAEVAGASTDDKAEAAGGTAAVETEAGANGEQVEATAGTKEEGQTQTAAATDAAEAPLAEASSEETASQSTGGEEIMAVAVGEEQAATAPGGNEIRIAALGDMGLREVAGYGSLGVGVVMIASGLVHALTRDAASVSINTETNVTVIRRRQSTAPGYSLLGIGVGIASLGAAIVWVEPMTSLRLFEKGQSTAQLSFVGDAVVLSGTW